MRELFKGLKLLTSCTYNDLANSIYCTKQYIHLLLANPTKKNDLKLARAMREYIAVVIDVETIQFKKRMAELHNLSNKILQASMEIVNEEESA